MSQYQVLLSLRGRYPSAATTLAGGGGGTGVVIGHCAEQLGDVVQAVRLVEPSASVEGSLSILPCQVPDDALPRPR